MLASHAWGTHHANFDDFIQGISCEGGSRSHSSNAHNLIYLFSKFENNNDWLLPMNNKISQLTLVEDYTLNSVCKTNDKSFQIKDN